MSFFNVKKIVVFIIYTVSLQRQIFIHHYVSGRRARQLTGRRRVHIHVDCWHNRFFPIWTVNNHKSIASRSKENAHNAAVYNSVQMLYSLCKDIYSFKSRVIGKLSIFLAPLWYTKDTRKKKVKLLKSITQVICNHLKSKMATFLSYVAEIRNFRHHG